MKVRDATGEVIGEVAELRADDQTGELRGILVSRDGELLGIDSENVDRIGDDVRLIAAGGEIRGREKT